MVVSSHNYYRVLDTEEALHKHGKDLIFLMFVERRTRIFPHIAELSV